MTNPQVRLIPPLDADHSTILAWLKEQHTRGLLPAEVAISTIIVLLEKLVAYNNGTYVWHEPQNSAPDLVEQLEVYKRAVKALRVYVRNRHVTDWDNMVNALNEVDHLEAETKAKAMEVG